MCYVLDQCVFTHPLVEGHHLHVKGLLGGNLKENEKTASMLAFFEDKQPPKYLIQSKKKRKVYPIKKPKGTTIKELRKASKIVKGPNPDHPDYWYITGKSETMSQFLERMNLKDTPNFHIQ